MASPAPELAPHFPPEHDGLRVEHAGAGDVIGAASLEDPAVLTGMKAQVRDVGFVVVRGLLGPAEVAELQAEISKDVAAWPAPPKPHTEGPPPYVDFDAAVTSGRLVPVTREMGVRRLFRLYSNNDTFRRLIISDKMMAPARAMLESDELVSPDPQDLMPAGDQPAAHQHRVVSQR